MRVLPLWPVLQPNRSLIRPEALADVRRVMEMAQQAGLDASVDVLQGHLSSFDFVPSCCPAGTAATCSPTQK